MLDNTKCTYLSRTKKNKLAPSSIPLSFLLSSKRNHYLSLCMNQGSVFYLGQRTHLFDTWEQKTLQSQFLLKCNLCYCFVQDVYEGQIYRYFSLNNSFNGWGEVSFIPTWKSSFHHKLTQWNKYFGQILLVGLSTVEKKDSRNQSVEYFLTAAASG